MSAGARSPARRGMGILLLLLLLALGWPCRTLGAQQSERGFALTGPAFLAVVVEDLDRGVAWYRTAFGLGVANSLDADDGSYAIRILTDGTLTVELLRLRAAPPAPTEPQAGLFKVGLFVDDIDAAHTWLRHHADGTDQRVLRDEALDLRFFVTRDPFGNRIQLFQRCDGRC